MADHSTLALLLLDPSENLTVEYKGWLDLTDQEHRGLLAKAAIALANEGGGHVVIGFSDDGPALSPLPRPAALAPYDQDALNNVLKKFAEPHFHCMLLNVRHPVTGQVHPVVSVPGGHGVPVMSKSGTAKSISAQVCYVRKPGPASAPAMTQAEWSRLFDRCIRNRQADMLDAIRSIVQGSAVLPSPGQVPEKSLQDDFVAKSRTRWLDLAGSLPANDPARCPLGRYEIDFYFDAGEAVRLPALLERMSSASRTRHTGWPPFWMPTRPEISPQPIDGAVECWLGRAEPARLLADAAHSDFWRMTPGVRAFLLRGYQEDGLESKPPGTLFDATLPIWRIGEIMLYAGRLAEASTASGQLQFRVRWSGLAGRKLAFVVDWSRSTGGDHEAAQDMVELEASVPLDRIGDNLPEILRPLLQPLYETFGFFDLPEWMVAQEVAKMRRGN